MFSDLELPGKVYPNYQSGKWIQKEGADLIEIRSPLDGSLVGKVTAMCKDDVDEAMDIAKRA